MPEEIKLKIGTKEIAIIIIVIAAVFFFVIYSWIGLRLFFGILLLFFLPFYIILDSFELKLEEKLIFSFFIGLGIVSLVVYYFSKILVSFRLSILACFIFLMAGSIIFRKFYKKKAKTENSLA